MIHHFYFIFKMVLCVPAHHPQQTLVRSVGWVRRRVFTEPVCSRQCSQRPFSIVHFIDFCSYFQCLLLFFFFTYCEFNLLFFFLVEWLGLLILELFSFSRKSLDLFPSKHCFSINLQTIIFSLTLGLFRSNCLISKHWRIFQESYSYLHLIYFYFGQRTYSALFQIQIFYICWNLLYLFNI